MITVNKYGWLHSICDRCGANIDYDEFCDCRRYPEDEANEETIEEAKKDDATRKVA